MGFFFKIGIPLHSHPLASPGLRSFLFALGPSMSEGRNVVHEELLWRQRLESEVQMAATWHDNWGFLGERPEAPVRGFSKNTAKYAGAGGYTVSSVRVADDSEEGLKAALAEQRQRQERHALTWRTPFPTPVKPVGIDKGPFKGHTLIHSSEAGIESREAALLLRAHNLQNLGDACRTQGVDPHHKYNQPVVDSHEYGWRVPTKTNNRPNLEMFGVAHYGRRDLTWS